jgi:hypothetical protein
VIGYSLDGGKARGGDGGVCFNAAYDRRRSVESPIIVS